MIVVHSHSGTKVFPKFDLVDDFRRRSWHLIINERPTDGTRIPS